MKEIEESYLQELADDKQKQKQIELLAKQYLQTRLRKEAERKEKELSSLKIKYLQEAQEFFKDKQAGLETDYSC
ncbi:hypothetical protein QN382_12190 [Pseudomonas sp. 10B1]|uniref:hypothetical protein n=1 Tax=unclassified Pseudomonas TaxID=196821 RepID=UPI002B23A97F|nr:MULTISPECIES: hypothetical protein [unclassified Pseudomonas]MEA9996198.1 hypothetical protein [Pseudomonas sp. AA4]MEB0088915.1 hypothetical protein [Pseudomonas sp. RTI1]MEB0128026.1 hypothetical protein [Pseudomonas sp. CCC1.2]MEB0154917.1 hypothetical protein [Pseudomonas sp. CCC4.3]MEB0219815.1 hypothetical protein [Pseudomonas sp. AB12(2023)]